MWPCLQQWEKQSWSAFGCGNINNNHHHQSYVSGHKWNSCLDKTDKSSTLASSLWEAKEFPHRICDIFPRSWKRWAIFIQKLQVLNKPVSTCQNWLFSQLRIILLWRWNIQFQWKHSNIFLGWVKLYSYCYYSSLPMYNVIPVTLKAFIVSLL